MQLQSDRGVLKLFHLRKIKTNKPKICITSDNSAFFLIIIFVTFRVLNRNWREYLKVCYLAIFLIAIFKKKNIYIFQIKDVSFFNFTSLQISSTNNFFQFRNYNIISLYIQIIYKDLKYKNHTNFHQFFLLLSVDERLNSRPFQISPAVKINIWEPFNKKGLNFVHITNSLLPKTDELKCIANSYWDNRMKNWPYCGWSRSYGGDDGGDIASYIWKNLCFNAE